MTNASGDPWYEHPLLWFGGLVLLLYLWAVWSPKPPPTTAQKLKGRWVNVASPQWQPEYEFQQDAPSGGPVIVTFGQGAARMTGRWEVRQQRLTLTLTEIPWQYRLMLWTNGITVPWVTRYEIHELTNEQLILDDGSGPEARDLFRYRRP